MSKKIIFFFILFLLTSAQTYSNWYYNWVAATNYNAGITNCVEDGDYAWWKQSFTTTTGGPWYATGTTYQYDSKVRGLFWSIPNEMMTCYFYDNFSPTWLSLTYPTWGQSSAVTINFDAIDTGGSGLSKIELYENVNGTWFWASPVFTWTSWAKQWTRTYVANNTYQYKIRAIDNSVLDDSYVTVTWNYSEIIWGTIVFDATPPTVTIDYFDGWTNSSQSVTITAIDSIRLNRIALEMSYSDDNGVNWSNYDLISTWEGTYYHCHAFLSCFWHNGQIARWNDGITYPMYSYSHGGVRWNDINVSNSLVTRNFVSSPVHGRWYRYRAYATDYNWNTSAYATVWKTMKFDTTAPTWVTFSPTQNQQATNALNVTATTIDDGLSPATSMSINFETSANPAWFTPYSWNSPLVFNHDVSLVDNDSVNWWRVYTLTVNSVCDQAGNCSGPFTYSYNIFANTSSIGVSNVSLNDFTWSDVADGTLKRIRITLRDAYNNLIQPAAGISRTIDFNFNVNNSLYLNQYKKQWWWWVFSYTPSDTSYSNSRYIFWTWSNINQFNNQSIWVGWVYEFWYRVYTPTYNVYSLADPDARFDINSISFDVNGSVWSRNAIAVNNSNIPFSFLPLYQTTITGDVKNDGLLEWIEKPWQIALGRNGMTTPTWFTNFGWYIEFWIWARQPVSELNLEYSRSTGSPSSPPDLLAIEWNQAAVTSLAPDASSPSPKLISSSTPTLYQFIWLVKQVLPSAPSSSVYMSTHIGYDVTHPNGAGTIQVAYNSDIVWKSNYWDDSWSSTIQTGIKVIWIWSSTNTWEVISWQFDDDIIVLGNINKSDIKKDIISKAYAAIKNVWSVSYLPGAIQVNNLTDFTSASNDWKVLQNNNMLYLWDLNGATVEIWDAALSTGEPVNWKKTILIIWWNAYIKTNLYYQNATQDILGIVVLKDKNWNGWNVYIDYNVTNVVWNIFAEKSLFWYDGSNIVPSNDFVKLKNQLHIYGSVYSENTIGGSRLTPPKCPYYVSSCATQSEAQDYDINFLRRFYIGSSGDPTSGWKVIWWWTCTWWVCSWWNALFQRNITNTSDTYIWYPVVIEYHTLISTAPPPLFSK